MLELRSADGSLVASNDNWQDDAAQREGIAASGIPPQHDSEAAIVTTLAPGHYTMIVEGKGGTSGISISEIYDVDAESSASTLANLSTRGRVETSDDLMIAGFILGGNNAGARVLVRALGPSLSSSGIVNVLVDPTLELHNSNGTLVAANNDWADEDEASISATGIAPGDSREAAILATVPQDNYTAVVKGVAGSVGIALVEVYMVR